MPTVDTDGWHCIQMKGVDQVGNVQTMGLRFFWELDTTAPDVWLSGIDQLPFCNCQCVHDVFRSVERGHALVWWAVDSVGWTQLVNTSSFTATVEGDGEHSLHLKVVDQVGNEFVNASVWVWMLDTAPPIAKLISDARLAFFHQHSTFEMHAHQSPPMAEVTVQSSTILFTWHRLRAVVRRRLTLE